MAKTLLIAVGWQKTSLWLWENPVWQLRGACLNLFCSFYFKYNVYRCTHAEKLHFYTLQVNKPWGRRERSPAYTAWEGSSSSPGVTRRRAEWVRWLLKNGSCSSQCLVRQLSHWVRNHSPVLLAKSGHTFILKNTPLIRKRKMCMVSNHQAVVNK